ncbi:MAG: hypothetical protein HQL30_04730 [Candidatus Omnitrophica bacterium]|nr:hypothetical protein [Candidatus Omnitrophota bacterium]
MKTNKTFVIILLMATMLLVHRPAFARDNSPDPFTTSENKKAFAREISLMIGKAWKEWQDKVEINDVAVDGSGGVIFTGAIHEPSLTKRAIMKDFVRGEKSRAYAKCVVIISEALEDGMRKWQWGYSNGKIIFPQGSSCLYTLTPCRNMPLGVSRGKSSGRGSMESGELYDLMYYRAPSLKGNYLKIFKAASVAIAECFTKWEEECVISGITAKGGVAPSPSPLGQGPGPVRGATGNGGRLTGAYFDGELMYVRMCRILDELEGIEKGQGSGGQGS